MFYLYIFLSIAVVLVIFSIPFAIISNRLRNKKLEKVFAGRQELNERDFYERFFEAKGVPFFIVQKIRRILRKNLTQTFQDFLPKTIFLKI
jgi:hypothetical protein